MVATMTRACHTLFPVHSHVLLRMSHTGQASLINCHSRGQTRWRHHSTEPDSLASVLLSEDSELLAFLVHELELPEVLVHALVRPGTHTVKIAAHRVATYRQDVHDLNTSIAGIRIRLLPIRFQFVFLLVV